LSTPPHRSPPPRRIAPDFPFPFSFFLVSRKFQQQDIPPFSTPMSSCRKGASVGIISHKPPPFLFIKRPPNSPCICFFTHSPYVAPFGNPSFFLRGFTLFSLLSFLCCFFQMTFSKWIFLCYSFRNWLRFSHLTPEGGFFLVHTRGIFLFMDPLPSPH